MWKNPYLLQPALGVGALDAIMCIKECFHRQQELVLLLILRQTDSALALWFGNHAQPQIPCDAFDDFRGNRGRMFGVSGKQGVFADGVDQPRNSAGVEKDSLDGGTGENLDGGGRARNRQAAPHVLAGFARGELVEMAAKGDPLLQLTEFVGIEFLIELGLTGQHDLQQLLLRSFEVGQKPDFLEEIRRQMVRLVDHQNGRQSLLMPLQQEAIQPMDQFVFGPARYRQSEIAGNIAYEFQRRKRWIEDEREGYVAALQQPQ